LPKDHETAPRPQTAWNAGSIADEPVAQRARKVAPVAVV